MTNIKGLAIEYQNWQRINNYSNHKIKNSRYHLGIFISFGRTTISRISSILLMS